ncbi:hypothetical protein J6590_082671 [Homalodisca vitripennis]|nr:hypothetical protein J6590_082671 [Homalodisca vitripennis]
MGKVRAKRLSLTFNLGTNGLKVTSGPPPTAGQAGCLQGQDRSAITLPSSSHARLCLIRLQKKAIRTIANINFRESCRPAFKKLQLLTLLCLYILEAVLFCKSKCALTRGRDVHEYETRGRDNYRTGRHRTVVYEHLPSQAGVRFINSLPDSMKNVQSPKALKTRLKRFLASKAFYSVDELLNYSWETSNLED